MSDGERRVAEALDPASYVAHVTKTALLLERLAEDVSALRRRTEEDGRTLSELQASISSVKQDLAVFKERTQNVSEANATAIREVEERARWLTRLVIGALISAILGGAVAFIFQALKT